MYYHYGPLIMGIIMVLDTTNTTNVLHAIFHMVSQSSILDQSIQPLS